MTEVTYKDLKEGDRIEITLKGKVVVAGEHYIATTLDGGSGRTSFFSKELAQAKITLLEPKLKKGRAERICSGSKGHIVHIEGDTAWFRYDSGGRDFVHIKVLRNIPEDTDLSRAALSQTLEGKTNG